MTDTNDNDAGDADAAAAREALRERWRQVPTQLTANVFQDELGYRAVGWTVTDASPATVVFTPRRDGDPNEWVHVTRHAMVNLQEWE